MRSQIVINRKKKTRTLLIQNSCVWDFIDKFTKLKRMITWRFLLISKALVKHMILRLISLQKRNWNFYFTKFLFNCWWNRCLVKNSFFKKDNRCLGLKEFLMTVVNNLLRLFSLSGQNQTNFFTEWIKTYHPCQNSSSNVWESIFLSRMMKIKMNRNTRKLVSMKWFLINSCVVQQLKSTINF